MESDASSAFQILFRLRFMAGMTQYLTVVFGIRSTVSECNDVVQLEAVRVFSQLLAHGTQWVGAPQLLASGRSDR